MQMQSVYKCTNNQSCSHNPSIELSNNLICQLFIIKQEPRFSVCLSVSVSQLFIYYLLRNQSKNGNIFFYLGLTRVEQ